MMTYVRLAPWALSAALLASSVALLGLYASARDDLARAKAEITEARASVRNMGRLLDAQTSNCDPAADREWLRAFGND